MMQAVQMTTPGDPEAMTLSPLELGAPGAGQVKLRHTAIGLNFIDTYHRSGLYPLPMPTGLGIEAAGVVEALGEDVEGLSVGQRVAYCWGPPGGYATHRLIDAARVVALPDAVSDEVAAAGFLKGCTVEFLVERCARVQAGQWALVHAAAGGVGLLLVQWLKHIGAHVIAMAGSADKVARAIAAGADHGLVQAPGFAAEVRALTGGRGVDVVFDGIGKETFESSLDSLKKRGLMVSYGNASGPVGEIDFGMLARKGSLFATRPALFDYYGSRQEMLQHGAQVLHMLATGALKVSIGQRYALADVAQAHRDLEARRTTGSTVLLP
jgi:NADPH2:quinone reductase